MFRRLIALHDRFAARTLRGAVAGPALHDAAGVRIGHVDRIAYSGGRLTVTGWAEAARLGLLLGGSESHAVPMLPRADVMQALGRGGRSGFELTVPATPDTLRRSAAPGLIVSRPGLPDQVLSLPGPRVARASAASIGGFLMAMARALPWMVRWRVTGRDAARMRAKALLGLAPLTPHVDLAPWILRTPPVEPSLPATRITIVLPVYNAYEMLTEALERVEAHTDLPWHLIAIEDASPDPRVRPFLRGWAADRPRRVTLLENETNLGFIGSVNRGLDAARAEPDADAAGPVVLLNSDAMVPAGWAGRLVRPFADRPDVASATPMSNAAEILSVPVICRDTALAPGQGDAIDAAARGLGAAPRTALPTGVGFCMALSRRWLAKVPRLDPAFGRGYGEEVDWCQRTRAKGAVHLAVPDLFVEHRGGGSFGAETKHALVARHGRMITARYPCYDGTVQDFVRRDPLRTARLALGLAWVGSLDPDRAVPVYLAHALGGGAEVALAEEVARDAGRGCPSVILRVGGARRFRLELVAAEGTVLGETCTPEIVTALLARLPKKRVIYSCGVGDPDPIALPGFLCDLLGPQDTAELRFHDYLPLSPAYTLLEADGTWRGLPRPGAEGSAHRLRRPDGTEIDLATWQTAWRRFAARGRIRVYSEASRDLVAAAWPDLAGRIRVAPHRLRLVPGRVPAPTGPDLRLGVLGNIGRQKGAGVVASLARRMQAVPGCALVVVGNMDPAFPLPAGVKVTGDYHPAEIAGLARRHGITHWLIPSIWPETFCFALHEALATGLPTLAFDLGAQGAAARAAANGRVLPFDPDADLAATVLETLLAGRETEAPEVLAGDAAFAAAFHAAEGSASRDGAA